MNENGILIISTGGTFNKVYNPITGELEIDKKSLAVREMIDRWMAKFKLTNIISKDSLDMNDRDRELLAQTIKEAKFKKILIIHGTDTITESAKVVASKIKDKMVVFVGAMVPFSINPVEASLNFALGVGFLEANPKEGVYIAMHSIVREWNRIYKDKRAGLFRELSSKE